MIFPEPISNSNRLLAGPIDLLGGELHHCSLDEVVNNKIALIPKTPFSMRPKTSHFPPELRCDLFSHFDSAIKQWTYAFDPVSIILLLVMSR